MKLLFIDLETSPIVAYLWDIYKPHVGIDQVITPTSILCVGAKWCDEPKTMFFRSVKQSGRDFDAMIRAAHKLLCEADAVCHYNGKSFDVPRLNQEFLRLGLPPPPTIPQIDLLKVVREKFSLVSNKLAFVGPYFSVGEKVKNSGWDLWKGCLAGDKDSWALMQKYNLQDVVLLEKLYKKLLPWIDQHPNMNLFEPSVEPVCPNCGSFSMTRRGVHLATTYCYARYSCNNCGRWSRARGRSKVDPVAERR